MIALSYGAGFRVSDSINLKVKDINFEELLIHIKGAKGKGKTIVTKIVHHPGTQARKFAETINDKWDKEWPRQIARAIKAVMRFK